MYEELILTVLMTSVPLVYAAIGELVVERSGVLNLGCLLYTSDAADDC